MNLPRALLACVSVALVGCASAPTRPLPLQTERVGEPPYDTRYPARVRTQAVARSATTHEWLWRGMYRVRSQVPCTNGPLEIPIEWPQGAFGLSVELNAWSDDGADLDAMVDVQAGGKTIMLPRGRPAREPMKRITACAAKPSSAPPAAAVVQAATVSAPGTPAVAELEPVRESVPTEPVVTLGNLPASGSRLAEGWFSLEAGLPERFADPGMPSQRSTPVGAYPDAPTAVVRVWLPVAQDLAGLVFEVTVKELHPLVPAAEFVTAARAATATVNEQDARQRAAFRAACASKPLTDASCWLQPGSAAAQRLATRPPPAPRVEHPPAASTASAEWIGGTWRWDGAKYDWVGGFWREPPPGSVPMPARAAQPAPPPVAPPALVRAPPAVKSPPAAVPVSAPPTIAASLIPPRPAVLVELAPPAPAADVEWVAGFWSWQAGAWVWVAGRWHPLPFPAARWVPPRITIDARGLQVELPGSWVPRP